MDGEHVMIFVERILGDVLGPRWLSSHTEVTPEQWDEITEAVGELASREKNKEQNNGNAGSGDSQGERTRP